MDLEEFKNHEKSSEFEDFIMLASHQFFYTCECTCYLIVLNQKGHHTAWVLWPARWFLLNLATVWQCRCSHDASRTCVSMNQVQTVFLPRKRHYTTSIMMHWLIGITSHLHSTPYNGQTNKKCHLKQIIIWVCILFMRTLEYLVPNEVPKPLH